MSSSALRNHAYSPRVKSPERSDILVKPLRVVFLHPVTDEDTIQHYDRAAESILWFCCEQRPCCTRMAEAQEQ